MPWELVAQLVEQLGVGAVVALVILAYERSKRETRVLEANLRRIEQLLERVEDRLESLEKDVRQLSERLGRAERQVAYICAKMNGGRACI